MKAKKYNYGGKMSEESGEEIEIKSMDMASGMKQLEAAVKASGKAPSHYKFKACFYEESED
jgi:phosphoribosyl-AMP cyclohydrolase